MDTPIELRQEVVPVLCVNCYQFRLQMVHQVLRLCSGKSLPSRGRAMHCPMLEMFVDRISHFGQLPSSVGAVGSDFFPGLGSPEKKPRLLIDFLVTVGAFASREDICSQGQTFC